MFSQSLRCLIPLAAAKSLFIDDRGKPHASPRAPLPDVLTALAEHYKTVGEPVTLAAMQHIVQLDASNGDTEIIAACRPSSTSINRDAAATTTSGMRIDFTGASGHVGQMPPIDEDKSEAAATHLMVQLMKAYPHNMEIRERCCRCLANMCQLSVVDRVHNGNAANSLAETLVQEGAMELVLGTMTAMHRLSEKGKCWTALAALNLMCLSRSGAARAAAAGAEETLAEFLLVVLEDAQGREVLPVETTTALDAALGALTGVLAAEAPENTKSISFNYEKVGYSAVDAVVRCALKASALLVRDGRNDGAYGASLPSKRYGTLLFATASATQQQATAELLPVLQKAWMSLQHMCEHTPNMPLVFDTLYDAANSNQESARIADDDGDTLAMTDNNNKKYVAALSTLVEAALFLVTELEGLEEVAPELAQLQNALRLSVMECMANMTATRRDLSSDQVSQAEAAASSDDAAVSAVLPTTAAMAVSDVLASGAASNMALATAVRIHADHGNMYNNSQSKTGSSALRPYSSSDFTLLSKSLIVLAHLGEAQDEVVASANAVAAMQAMLKEAHDALHALLQRFPEKQLVELFYPSCEVTDTHCPDNNDNSNSSNSSAALQPDDHLGFVQLAALIGQSYSVLSSSLRTPKCVRTVVELEIPKTAQSLQEVLTRLHAFIGDAHKRYELKDTSGKTQWIPSASEESLVRLVKLGEEFNKHLSEVSAHPNMAS